MPPKNERPEMLSVTITITRTVAELLALLDDAGGGETQPIEMRVARVLLQLADHAQQGVYRNGAWERAWLAQAFNRDVWLPRTEPGHPHSNDRNGPVADDASWQRMFRRPRAGYFDGVPLTMAEWDGVPLKRHDDDGPEESDCPGPGNVHNRYGERYCALCSWMKDADD